MGDFKSQVCTSVEQSKRLLELGLKKETADMMYRTYENIPEEYRYYELVPEFYRPCIEGVVHIPAWSLHRLLILLDKGDIIGTGVYIDYMNVEESYEVVISRIANLLRIGAFDEDYLEVKK